MSVRRYSTSRDTPNGRLDQDASERGHRDIIYSAAPSPDLQERVEKLLLSTWKLSSSNKGITRHYTFSTFSRAWQFMSEIAVRCKIQRHHPSWSNSYNTVTIEWTTHEPEGLSIKDVNMAEFCDQVAKTLLPTKTISRQENDTSG
jgi:4a-hydroxytetrahydrobiopterin dehydratase